MTLPRGKLTVLCPHRRSDPEVRKNLQQYRTVVVNRHSFKCQEDTSLNLVPNCFYSERINSEKIEKGKKEISFVAEFLYLVPKSELKEKGIQKLENITMDEISVVFRSISKMQGMLYHFEKPGKEKVLYEKTYMIANLDSDEPIPDQNTGNADGQVSYCYQDEDYFNYHGIQNALCGKIRFNGGGFTPKRILVIQME